MDTYNSKLIRFQDPTLNTVLSNLTELLKKIEIQLLRTDLSADEYSYLKSNYLVLLKFETNLIEQNDLL